MNELKRSEITPTLTENHLIKTSLGWLKVSEVFQRVKDGEIPEISILTVDGIEVTGKIALPKGYSVDEKAT